MRGREPHVPAAAGDAPGVGGHVVAPGHRRRGPVDGELWASSPSVRLMTTGRVDGAFVFHARLKESQQTGRGPKGPMPARVAGLFERDTAALEHKGQRKEHGWVLVSKSLTLPPAQPRAGGVI